MASPLNHQLLVLETEQEHTEMRLRQQIESMRTTLNNLERKLDKDDTIYDSDGFQGNATFLDMYVVKYATYQRSIEQFKKHLERESETSE